MNNMKMLYYDRIDISEGIDVNKTNKSKDSNILKINDLSFNHMYGIDAMIY